MVEMFEGWMQVMNAGGQQGLVPINYTDFKA
jgi:hypothetical protein